MACILCGIAFTLVVLVLSLKIYIKLSTRWCKSQKCLVGKTALVTGANTGIGYETALDFAKRGAKVILACRNEKLAEEARRKIIQETDNDQIEVKLVDFTSFQSVKAFAKEIIKSEERLDILVNNAGVAGMPEQKTEDGHQTVMQINYFSSFLLTMLLMGLLKKTKNSRIVNVSSMAAKWARNFDVNLLDTFAGRSQIYFHSKLCNILFTMELAKKLKGATTTVYSLHPGAVKTDIFRHAKSYHKIFLDMLCWTWFKTSEEGAQTSIYCSVAKGIEKHSGEHFEECRRVEPYGTTKTPGLSKQLWDVTMNILQLKPEEIEF